MKKRVCALLRQDNGASLVIIMAIMIVVAITMTAMLAATGNNMATAGRLGRQLASDQLNTDVDNALQVAVNQVRSSDYNNNFPEQSSCQAYGFGDPSSDGLMFAAAATASGQDVVVTCDPKAGTGGGTGSVMIDENNRPQYALLTLGTDTSSDGFEGIYKDGPGTLRISGPVYTNATIDAQQHRKGGTSNQGKLIVTALPGDPATTPLVTAHSLPCFGSITPACVAGGIKPWPENEDPPADPAAFNENKYKYGQPPTQTAVLKYRSIPSTSTEIQAACSGAQTVAFEPGYYDDGVGLTNLMNNSACADNTFWFKPESTEVDPVTGNAKWATYYYFDFHNGEGGGLPEPPQTDACTNADGSYNYDCGIAWSINNTSARVVAGTPSGWDPTKARSSTNIPKIGVQLASNGTTSTSTSCVSPLRTTTKNPVGGVSFVFGGSSRLQVTKGQFEICGQYRKSAPAIAIYGAVDGKDKAGDPTDVSATAFAPASKAVTIKSGAYTGTITASGFTMPAVPAGAILTDATLSVTHQESNQDGSLNSLNASVVASTGGTPTQLANVNIGKCPHEGETCTSTPTDITASIFDEVTANGLGNLSVGVIGVGSSGDNVTESVGSVVLTLTFEPLDVFSPTGYSPASKTATIKAGSYTQTITANGISSDSVPAGSILTSARLILRHQETNTTGTLNSLKAVIKDSGGTALATETISLCAPATAACTDTSLDLAPALATAIHDNGLDKWTIDVTATGSSPDNVLESVDWTKLMLTWEPPTVRMQTESASINTRGRHGGKNHCNGRRRNQQYCGFLTFNPSQGQSGSTTIGGGPKLYVQGTTYAPHGQIDAWNYGTTEISFSTGVIVRALDFYLDGDTPSKHNRKAGNPQYHLLPLISLPQYASGAFGDVGVYFRAYTCPRLSTLDATTSPPTCTGGGDAVVAGTAYVTYNTNVDGNRSVKIESWEVQH
ncbi:MAG: hypothetical protein WCP28_01070 [Actinomycetes bacterium]